MSKVWSRSPGRFTHRGVNASGERGNQWGSKALRGPGSTVTWGPSFSLPSTSPSLPSPSPFPSSSQPSPSPCTKRPPNPAIGGLGSVLSYPSGVWGGAPAEIEFDASGGNNFNDFPKSLAYNFSVAPLLGGPRSSGAPVH